MARAKGRQTDMGDENEGNDDIPEYIPVGMARLPPPIEPDPETDAELKTDDLLFRMGPGDDIGTGYVAVTRPLGGGNSKEQHVEHLPSDKYRWEELLEYLRENYGPGEYRIRLFIKSASGRHHLKGNKLASIAARITAAPSTAVVRSDGGSGDMTRLMAEMIAQMQRNNEALVERLERQNAQQGQGGSDMVNFLTGLTGIATAIAPFVVPMLQNRKSGGDEIDKLGKLIAISKGVSEMGGAAPAGAGPAGATAMDAVVAGLQALPQILAMRNATQRPALAPPVPTSAAPASAPPAPAGDPAHPLHPLFTMLVGKARAGADVEEEARQLASMLAMAPESDRASSIGALEMDDFMKQAVAVQPDILDVMDWFLELRDALLDILVPDQDDSEDHSSDGQSSDGASTDDRPADTDRQG